MLLTFSLQHKNLQIKSEEDLVREIVRIAKLSMKLGYQIETENRMLSKEEAYVQMGTVLRC